MKAAPHTCNPDPGADTPQARGKSPKSHYATRRPLQQHQVALWVITALHYESTTVLMGVRRVLFDNKSLPPATASAAPEFSPGWPAGHEAKELLQKPILFLGVYNDVSRVSAGVNRTKPV
eukprot:CAMPEP_0174303982 /NCGR_PEP_ID=MMETSP0809-20121228/60507_1 /TAXON_ID=73025 ORGANISM="Eutreptiella gymnastica-like, Strain CCMP1594" /NCGR_SAMPLE_ID=MMETSP0809 /ASSEMBLY_ACC=CAM_ASM_000658 /LENGTH=119 /DNA_ID=CAMNT_0015410111 /DNA_START=957 /DNA_END=1317 /DNA_ORIENTATION=+